MQVKLKKGVLSRVLRQPLVEGDEREALDQAGAMVVDERLEVGRPLLVPVQGSAPLPTGCVYGCDPVRGSSGIRSDLSREQDARGSAFLYFSSRSIEKIWKETHKRRHALGAGAMPWAGNHSLLSRGEHPT